jgi:hypothetical protein
MTLLIFCATDFFDLSLSGFHSVMASRRHLVYGLLPLHDLLISLNGPERISTTSPIPLYY